MLRRWTFLGAFAWLSIYAAGCGTLENGRGWGQDAIYPVDLSRLPRAAKKALFDPITYVPAAAALIFAIDDFDERVSDWAVRHNPVFGSESRASDASDYLRGALIAEAFATAVIAPSGDEPAEWASAKAKGIGVEALALGGSWLATNGLKVATDRTRPDRSDDRSFPSGHATSAFSAAALASRNLDSIQMKNGWRTALTATNIALASSVAWARVEGQRHFPSDVLAGAVLGNFLTVVIHDSFIGLRENGNLSLYIEPAKDGGKVIVSWSF
ncbi:MAG: phosphatase PAP2 family protein [Candidatus Methylomirabilia bacterium]